MKNISASTYALFYAGSNIAATVYYNGIHVIAFTPAGNYYRITFYNGVEKNIRPHDTLTIHNTNNFIVK